MSDDTQSHWDAIYQSKPDEELSWHELEPAVSLELISAHAPRGARVIDMGGGSSGLAGQLLRAGVSEVTVVDISAAAIVRSQARHAGMMGIHWVVADVRSAAELGSFDVWHDRAVFHFLTSDSDRTAYAMLAAQTVHPGGHLVLATFALDGPEKCSGLPVARYDAAMLANAFIPDFTPVGHRRHVHMTPWGRPQAFTFVVLERAH